MGIEPTQSAWKAEVLPLNYTRITRTPDPAAQLAKARPPQSPTAALPRERKARAPRSIASDLRRFAPASNRFFGSHPHRTRRWEDFQQLGGGGRITPRLRRSALRAAALTRRSPALRACVEPLFGSCPPPEHDVGRIFNNLVEGGGFEPPKAEPSDLQSDPFGRSGTPPKKRRYSVGTPRCCQPAVCLSKTWRASRMSPCSAVLASLPAPCRGAPTAGHRPPWSPRLCIAHLRIRKTSQHEDHGFW